MKFQKGDLVYVPKLKSYSDDYVLVTGKVKHHEGIYQGYSVISLTDRRDYYYNADWFDNNTKKIG